MFNNFGPDLKCTSLVEKTSIDLSVSSIISEVIDNFHSWLYSHNLSLPLLDNSDGVSSSTVNGGKLIPFPSETPREFKCFIV